MSISRNIGREIGTALAVLAIYLLTLLAPLHHARASQLAFNELGYVTTEAGWVLCTPMGVQGDDGDVLVAKCPATGVGKTEFVLPALNVLQLGRDTAALAAPLFTPNLSVLPRAVAPPGGSRGPPAQV